MEDAVKMNIIWFLLGTFVGAGVTILGLALGNAASDRDEWSEFNKTAEEFLELLKRMEDDGK